MLDGVLGFIETHEGSIVVMVGRHCSREEDLAGGQVSMGSGHEM